MLPQRQQHELFLPMILVDCSKSSSLHHRYGDSLKFASHDLKNDIEIVFQAIPLHLNISQMN